MVGSVCKGLLCASFQFLPHRKKQVFKYSNFTEQSAFSDMGLLTNSILRKNAHEKAPKIGMFIFKKCVQKDFVNRPTSENVPITGQK